MILILFYKFWKYHFIYINNVISLSTLYTSTISILKLVLLQFTKN